MLRLIENDYSLLRKFEGRSKFTTYLTAVIGRLLLEERQRAFGKWRPSREAKRRGSVATRLERFIYRDRMSVDEAIEAIRTNERQPSADDSLRTLVDHLPSQDHEAVHAPDRQGVGLNSVRSRDSGWGLRRRSRRWRTNSPCWCIAC
jgi:hypothetical protein